MARAKPKTATPTILLRPSLGGRDGFGAQDEQARSRRRTADERAQKAHYGTANDVRIHQSEDRDASNGIRANAGGEQRISDRGKSGDRREFENQMRHDMRRSSDSSSQPGHAAGIRGRSQVVAERLDGHGLNDVARRARIQRCQRPTQRILRNAFRQKREEGDRNCPPKEAQQELLRLRVGRRIGEPPPEQGELRRCADAVSELSGQFPDLG